ncbi:hypothetical protein AB0M34_32425 [Nocardia sp. NPDC050193]
MTHEAVIAAIGSGPAAIGGFAALILLRSRVPVLRRLATHKFFPPFRGWHARPHPAARVPVHTASRPRKLTRHTTEKGMATLLVYTGYSSYPAGARRLDFRTARPNVPVIYVDGYPVSWGWGVTRVVVSAGEHLIAVAGSHSRCYRRVHLTEGANVTLYYSSVLGADAHRFREADADLHEGVWLATARPGRTTSGERRAAMVVWAMVIAVAVVTLLGITSGLLGSPLGDRLPIGALLAYGAAGVGVCGGLVLVAGAIVDAHRPSPPSPTVAAPADHARPDVHIVDYDASEPPSPAPGWSALSLHLRYELVAHTAEEWTAETGEQKSRPNPIQWWRAIRIGEADLPGARVWIPAPGVAIDGIAVPASWTRMWIQLVPGIHQIYTTADTPPTEVGDSTQVDLTAAHRRHTIVARKGETHHLEYVAHIRALPLEDRRELASYRVKLQ